jgi:hypothetical protein
MQHDQKIDKAGLYAWLPVCTRELDLAKVGVEGSSPFARSKIFPKRRSIRSNPGHATWARHLSTR